MPNLTEFPSSPQEGRIAFVDDALFVFTNVDGLDSWYPMTNRTRRYVHNQSVSSSSWVVTHDLGTQQLLVICYDNNGDLLTPSNITYDTDNQITITQASAQTGDCAIFIDIAEELSSAGEYNEKIVQGNTSLEIIDTGTGEIKGSPDGNDVFNLTDTLQRIGKSVATKIEVNQNGTITIDGTTVEVDGLMTFDAGLTAFNPTNDHSATTVKFGRTTEQFMTLHGASTGNMFTAKSTDGNPKPFYIDVNTDSTSKRYIFHDDVAKITIDGDEVWHEGNDGAGSGLNADLLDGVEGANFLRSDVADQANGLLTANAGIETSGGADKGVFFESGKHHITSNDGGGNFNIRVGNTFSAGITEAGYASHWAFDQAAGRWDFKITSASQAVSETPSFYVPFQIYPTSVKVAGSITVTGTVDGRDVASDGTKLDGVETGAEVNNINDTNATALTDGGQTALHKHDHGALDGRSDDDHTQYSLVGGTRAFTGVVSGVTPTATDNLVTKGYVDGLVSGLDWQESVLDKDLNAPPGSPNTGDRYLISTAPPTATGAWLGHDNEFGEWNGSSWDFTSVSEGSACWVEDEDVLYTYNGTDWVKLGTTDTHNNLTGLNDGDYKHLTATELTKLTGIETGAEVNNISDVNATDLTDAGLTDLHRHDELYSGSIKTLEGFVNATANEAGLRILSEDNTYGGHFVADDDDNSIKLFGGLTENNLHFVGKSGGASEIYHNNNKAFMSMDDGSSVGAGIHLNGQHGDAKITVATDAFYLWSEENGSIIEIGGFNDSTAYKAGVRIDPNAGTSLYHTGTAKLNTLAAGAYFPGDRQVQVNSSTGIVSIKGSAGGWATGLNFLDSSGNNEGGYWALGSGDTLSYYAIGKTYTDTGIKVYPDAQTELSYDNVTHLATYAGGGIASKSTLNNRTSYFYPDSAGGTYLQNGTAGAVTYFYNINSSASGRYLVFAPNIPALYPSITNAYNLGHASYAWHTVYAYTGTIQSSDERKKENITTSDLGLDFINDLNPVSFKFKDYDYEDVDPISGETEEGTMTHHRTHYGLISQEVLSTLTAHGKTTEEFGGYIHNEDDDYYGLRYEEFVSPLIKSVQELSTTCAAQQTVIEDLTSRLEALEA